MQTSFADLEYDRKKKATRRNRFLDITPWSALVAELEGFYPKGGGRGRPPIGLERMLRRYMLGDAPGYPRRGENGPQPTNGRPSNMESAFCELGTG